MITIELKSKKVKFGEVELWLIFPILLNNLFWTQWVMILQLRFPETRFTLDRGFSKESRRGGGGFIKISRISADSNNLAMMVLENVGEELSYKRMNQILQRLTQDKIIKIREMELVKVALSDEALNVPLMLKDKLRANAFKCVLIDLMKEGDN